MPRAHTLTELVHQGRGDSLAFSVEARSRRSPPACDAHPAPWGRRTANSAPGSGPPWPPAPNFRNATPLKSVGLAAAMSAALVARGVPDPIAQPAGELDVLAFKRGYAQCSEDDRDDAEGLAHHTLAALHELRAATASLG